MYGNSGILVVREFGDVVAIEATAVPIDGGCLVVECHSLTMSVVGIDMKNDAFGSLP